jgi:hypothetical protein
MIGEICGVNSSCGVHKGKVCKVGEKRAKIQKRKGKSGRVGGGVTKGKGTKKERRKGVK